MADIYTMTLPDGTTCNMRDSRVDTIPGTVENIVDLIYPIGSIYMSVSSTDPSVLFENTVWQRITDTFLLAAGSTYPAASTGGAATVKLTGAQSGTSEHTHGHSISVAKHASKSTGGSGALTAQSAGGHAHRLRLNDVGASGTARNIPVSTSALSNSTFTDTTGAHTHNVPSHTHSIGEYTHTVSGSITKSTAANATQAHNNMPPYLAVYVWKRTA